MVQRARHGGAVRLAAHHVARHVGDRVQAGVGRGGAAQRRRQPRGRERDRGMPGREPRRRERCAGARTASEAHGRPGEAVHETREGTIVADGQDVASDDPPAGADGVADRRVGRRGPDPGQRPGARGHVDARDLVLEQRSQRRPDGARIAGRDCTREARGSGDPPDRRDLVAAVGGLGVDAARHGRQLGMGHAGAGRGGDGDRRRRRDRGRARPAGDRHPRKRHGGHRRYASHGRHGANPPAARPEPSERGKADPNPA